MSARIQLYIVEDRGRVLVVPIGANGPAWIELLNRSEFTPEQVSILKRLGVDIEIVTKRTNFTYREAL